jgi:3,4-dihydroxy 2-butanone 4-phosphate synthase/GTP cyclohydrolase II
MTKKILVEKAVCARIPTLHGEFQLCLYHNNKDKKEHLAFVRGDVIGSKNVLVRVHSECFTGDVLGSERCDCGEQLDSALERIAKEGAGVVVYMRQEGRGIGLQEKLRAYNLQDEGYDTVDANLMLGHQADNRDYSVAAAILADLKIKSIRLITNNPTKIEKLKEFGVDVVERVESKPTINPNNESYIRTKVNRMNHLLDLPSLTMELDEKDDEDD